MNGVLRAARLPTSKDGHEARKQVAGTHVADGRDARSLSRRSCPDSLQSAREQRCLTGLFLLERPRPYRNPSMPHPSWDSHSSTARPGSVLSLTLLATLHALLRSRSCSRVFFLRFLTSGFCSYSWAFLLPAVDLR